MVGEKKLMETSLQYSSLEFQNSLENYYYMDKKIEVFDNTQKVQQRKWKTASL